MIELGFGSSLGFRVCLVLGLGSGLYGLGFKGFRRFRGFRVYGLKVLELEVYSVSRRWYMQMLE